MKLLVITSLFPTKVNSVRGIFVKEQLKNYPADYEISVFSTDFSQPSQSYEYQDGRFDVTYVAYKEFRAFRMIWSYYQAISKILKRKLNEIKPDMIHIHCHRHSPELICLTFLLKDYQDKTVLTLHNVKQINKNFMLDLMFKRVINFFPKIITVSYKVKKMINSKFPDKDIKVIPNAINLDLPKLENEQISSIRSELKQDNFNIISVGNLISSKGFDLLIKAAAKIDNCHLYIVGEGGERDNLEALTMELDVKDRVEFLGRIEHDTLMNLYPFFDCFVLPSWSETFGIVYLEAMYSKLPVIGVKGEGIDGVITDGENGLLMEPKNLNDLIAKIILIKNSNRLADKIAQSGFETVKKHYSFKRIIPRIENIYERR